MSFIKAIFEVNNYSTPQKNSLTRPHNNYFDEPVNNLDDAQKTASLAYQAQPLEGDLQHPCNPPIREKKPCSNEQGLIISLVRSTV
ncbi:hypothetical protein D3H65_26910 [Paraflavitalea soli]|uniref:Uncharacterized protein n=1 Tax=Paraflavitalea soli TaxID=2315862 RepID=A0A3B7MTE2_9BACT|nr:hypothetical protein D3H65_26910 [Paraflavitalea soli]